MDDPTRPIPCALCTRAGPHLAAICALDIDPDDVADLLIDHLTQLLESAETAHPGARRTILQIIRDFPLNPPKVTRP